MKGSKMAESLNPVTFTGSAKRESSEKVALTVGRLHLGTNEGLQKFLTAVMWTGDDTNPQVLGHIVIDEDHFVRGLKLLFPNGELK